MGADILKLNSEIACSTRGGHTAPIFINVNNYKIYSPEFISQFSKFQQAKLILKNKIEFWKQQEHLYIHKNFSSTYKKFSTPIHMRFPSQFQSKRKSQQFYTDLFQQDLFYKQRLEEDLRYKKQKQFETLKLHLDNCGALARRKWYCKLCEEENGEALLKDEKIYQDCGVRYCDKVKCILSRFAKQIESLKGIKRLQNLKKMDHLVIGFEPITKEQFINDFDKIKKQQERVMNSMFSKLRKKDFDIQAFKVLDITFTLEEDKIYIHYHIIAIPIKADRKKLFMKTTQQIRKDMLKRQRTKIPFHVQFFGLKDKTALLSYLSLRAVGLYKFNSKKENKYKIKSIRKLKELIEQKKFMLLKDIVPLEFYFKHFYNHRNFTTIGSLPYGSIIMDNVTVKYPNQCQKHGKLRRQDVRMELIIDFPPDPPPNPLNSAANHTPVPATATQHNEIREILRQKSLENKQNQPQKRFSRIYDLQNGKKPTLDFEDKLNLLSTGKC